MKLKLPTLWKLSAALLMLAIASCERADVTPETPTQPSVSQANSYTNGDFIFNTNGIPIGQVLRVEWYTGLFIQHVPQHPELEYLASLEFWQNGVLVLAAPHTPVTYDTNPGGGGVGNGVISYTIPAILNTGIYTTKVKIEHAGKSLTPVFTPGTEVTVLQGNITVLGIGKLLTPPVTFYPSGANTGSPQSWDNNYPSTYPVLWTASNFASGSNSAPLVRAYLMSTSDLTSYQVYTQDILDFLNINYPSAGGTYFFASSISNTGSATLVINEMNGANYYIPNGAYQVFIDYGGYQYNYSPTQGYIYASGPTINVVH
jgi:hypothetical protein